jgi:hypothetical protein
MGSGKCDFLETEIPREVLPGKKAYLIIHANFLTSRFCVLYILGVSHRIDLFVQRRQTSAPSLHFLLATFRVSIPSFSSVMRFLKWLSAAMAVVLNAYPAPGPQANSYSTNRSIKTEKTSSTPTVAEILHELQLAPSLPAKMKVLLPDPKRPDNLTYTFVNNTVMAPTGGTIALSHVDNFPALEFGDVAMAIGFLNPCGLNVPREYNHLCERMILMTGIRLASSCQRVLDCRPRSIGNWSRDRDVRRWRRQYNGR